VLPRSTNGMLKFFRQARLDLQSGANTKHLSSVMVCKKFEFIGKLTKINILICK